MSKSLENLVAAVVLQVMASKKWKSVPQIVQPSGPLPAEPWYDPYEDEREVPLIGEVIIAYAKEHSHRTRLTAYHVESAIANFLTSCHLHEHMPIFHITRETCKSWRQALLDGTTKRFQGRKANAWTIDRKIRLCAHWLDWCVSQEYLGVNPMLGLALPKRLVANSKVKKAAFSDVELATILAAVLKPEVSAHWRASGEPERVEFKWIVFCLAFTGARCMEVLQLSPVDLREIEGVLCFDFHRGEGNSLKNQPSVRVVPVHSQLVTLGFLDWSKTQQGPRLFPLLHPKGSPLVSMWFSRLLKVIGIKKPSLSLHSLRHTLTVKLAQQRTYPPLQNRLLGHAIGKSVEERTYMASLTFTPKELAEAIEKVRLPLELSSTTTELSSTTTLLLP